MFCVANVSRSLLYRFGFGVDYDRALAVEPHLRWVLEDFAARRDAIWAVDPEEGAPTLLKIFYEEREYAKSNRLYVPILLAFAFYGTAGRFFWSEAQQLLKDPDPAIRLAAIECLGEVGSQKSTEALLQIVHQPDPEPRRQAIIALSKIGDAAAFPELEAASSSDPELTNIVAIGRTRSDALARDDMREFVRLSLSHDLFYEGLVGAAHHIKDELTWALLSDQLDHAAHARAARVMRLSRVGSGDMGKVATRIAMDDTQTRALRVECLGIVGQSRLNGAVPHVCALVDREGPAIQGPAIVALGNLRSPLAAGTLLNHYDDAEGGLQPHIELAMWRIGKDLRDEDFRAWAAGEFEFAPHSVYFMGGRLIPSFQPAIAEHALQSADPRARREGAILLGSLGNGSERTLLEERLAGETDPLTRAVLQRAVTLSREREIALRP